MSTFTPITVDEERLTALQKLASATYTDVEGINVFWDDASRQVVYQVKSEEFRANGTVLLEPCVYDEAGYCEECGGSGNGSHQVIDCDGNLVWDNSEKLQEWWSSPDSNILESIAHFLGTPCSSINFTNIVLYGQGKLADDLQTNLHECDWSGFACEKFYLEFRVRTGGYFVGKALAYKPVSPTAEPLHVECSCCEPTLYRLETVQDGRYASPTCGNCSGYVKCDVLNKFETEVAEFVTATHGRL